MTGKVPERHDPLCQIDEKRWKELTADFKTKRACPKHVYLNKDDEFVVQFVKILDKHTFGAESKVIYKRVEHLRHNLSQLCERDFTSRDTKLKLNCKYIYLPALKFLNEILFQNGQIVLKYNLGSHPAYLRISTLEELQRLSDSLTHIQKMVEKHGRLPESPYDPLILLK